MLLMKSSSSLCLVYAVFKRYFFIGPDVAYYMLYPIFHTLQPCEYSLINKMFMKTQPAVASELVV